MPLPGEDIKENIDKLADQLDAKAAAKDADWAEEDAADAIDYAIFAVYDAQLAVLDALDARAYADERATIAGTWIPAEAGRNLPAEDMLQPVSIISPRMIMIR